jgi:hypothetical protein
MTVKILDVFSINTPKNENSKSEWIKIGVAFENKDGSLNVIFDAIPLNGKVHIRQRAETKSEEFFLGKERG